MDVVVMGGAVTFLAAGLILCSRPIQRIPPTPCLFPPSLVLLLCRQLCPPSSCCCQAPVYYYHCAGAGLWQSSRGQPLVEADRGKLWPWEEGEAWEQDDRGGGPADRGLPVRCASATGGEGPYSPTPASFAICDCCVPRLDETHPHHQLQGELHRDNKCCSDVRIQGIGHAEGHHRDHQRKEDAHVGGHNGKEGTGLRVQHRQEGHRHCFHHGQRCYQWRGAACQLDKSPTIAHDGNGDGVGNGGAGASARGGNALGRQQQAGPITQRKDGVETTSKDDDDGEQR